MNEIERWKKTIVRVLIYSNLIPRITSGRLSQGELLCSVLYSFFFIIPEVERRMVTKNILVRPEPKVSPILKMIDTLNLFNE